MMIEIRTIPKKLNRVIKPWNFSWFFVEKIIFIFVREENVNSKSGSYKDQSPYRENFYVT